MQRENRRRMLKRTVALGIGAASASTAKPAAENETLKTIQSLRTIHGNFTNKEIPDAAIDQIIAASLRAANASNMQSYSIIVVRDRPRMKEICGYAGSCLLLYCADYTRLKDTAAAMGYGYHVDNVVDFVTSGMNTMLAAQTAVIAAKSMGIDSLLTNGIHRGDMDRLWRMLDLPPTSCFPMIALVLGYPTEEPASLKGRLDGPGVVHAGKYRRATREEIDGIIARCDDPAQHIALNEEWRSNHKHYLDWFFKVWHNTKPLQEETQMFKLLKRSGFIDLQKA